MATRSLNVQITGDAKQLGVASKQADGHMDRLGKSGVKMGKMMAGGFAIAGAAAAGALVVGLKKSVDAAMEAEKSQARLEAQLKASGASYKAHAKEIDAVIQKHSKLAGVDDEDLQDAFTGIVRSTKSVSTAMKDMGLVTDLMRGKNMDAAKAGDLLSKVHNGNVSVLKRMGIAVDPVTKAQDKLKESTKNATAEQIRAAKETDKAATAQKGIAELQKRFGGQAEAYGKTAAGAQERFSVAVENLQEKIGAKLLPVIAKITNKVADFVGQMESGKGAGGRFAAAVTEVVSKIGGVVGKIREFGVHIRDMFSGGDKSATSSFGNIVSTVRKNVTAIIAFVRDLAARIKTSFSGITDDLSDIGRAWLKVQSVILGVAGYIGRKILPGLSQTIGGLASVVRGVIKIVAGLLSGDFKKAWEGAKTVVDGVFNALKGTIRGAWDALGPLMVSLAKFLIRKLGEGLKALPGALKDALVSSIEWAARNVPKLIGKALGALGGAITDAIKAGFKRLNPFGDGLGDGTGFISGGGGGTASLMGADSDLFPIVQTAGRFGLHTSSGLRPGAITSSGNTSFHASGDAVDESGPPGAMLKFFNYMKSTAGPKLRELIYTPGGVGIKDGRPFRYTGQVAADHFDHVHVAYTGPFGDGIGQAVSAARGAGFRGQDLINMVAIAGAESRYDAEAKNFKYPDHSIGFWQINQLAHHGRFGTDKQLESPATNARAAYQLFKSGGYSPWSTWPTAARGYLARARAAVSGSSGGGSGGSSKPKTQTVTSNPTRGYDPQAMYGGDKPETHTAVINGRTVRLPGPAYTPPSFATSIKGANPDATTVTPEAGPTQEDYILAAIARSRLTEDTGDDIYNTTLLRDLRKGEMGRALGDSDPRNDAAAIDAYAQATEALKSLQDAVTANTNALEEQRKQYETLIAQDYQTKYNVSQSQYGILAQAIADVANGGIGQRLGLGLSGLRAPAGSVARA